MDDATLQAVIIASSNRLMELDPLGEHIKESISSSYICKYLREMQDDLEATLASVDDNILLWNVLSYAIRLLSSPIVPLEYVHNNEISLELICFIMAKMDRLTKETLERILYVINMTLFPDLRNWTNEEKDSAIYSDDAGASFTSIIQTIGMCICRPKDSEYMSIYHKEGYEEIGYVLTLLLDNKKWLFDLSFNHQYDPETESNQLSSLSPALLSDKQNQELTLSSLSSLQRLVASSITIQPLSPLIQTTACRFSVMMSRIMENERRIQSVLSFISYGPLPIVPREEAIQEEADLSSASPSEYEIFFTIKSCIDHTYVYSDSRKDIESYPGRNDQYSIYDEYMDHLQGDNLEIASIILQSLIRSISTRFTHKVLMGSAITVIHPRKPLLCLCCFQKEQISAEIDYSCYFDEIDWMIQPQDLIKSPHDVFYAQLLSMQLQLLSVEDRIIENDKIKQITNNSYLTGKYMYYNRIRELTISHS